MYLVIDIGCLECEEETFVVGVFEDKDQAESVFDKLGGNNKSYAPQGRFLMFELPTMNTIGPEYVDKVSK